MTDQTRDEVNRYDQLGPIGRALVDDYDQIALAGMLVKTQDELARAEAELQQHAENESADAAAGSYALRAEGVEATLDRARQYARTEQELGNAITPDDLLAILNEDQAPAASRSPAAAETEPNNPRTTLDNPAASSWTPPPPGDRREQLPDHILALLDIPLYTSTACEAAKLLERQMPHALRRVELGGHADRLHARCRINNKFTGALCDCPCHRQAATLNSAAPNASRIEPDPPVAS